MKLETRGTWLSFALLFAACAAPTQPAAAPETRESVVVARSLTAVPAPVSVAAALDPKAARAAEEARVVASVIELGRADNRAEEHLRHLCLSIGPRLTSSHNLEKAQQWALERFRDYGLSARLERWGEFPVGFDRNHLRGHVVGEEARPFELTTPSWTPGTDGPRRGAALVRPETDEELEAVKDRLAGAWLVARPTRRGAERQRVPNEVRDRVNAAIQAAGVAGEVRSSGSELVHTGGNHEIRWDKLPKNVRVTLQGPQHAALLERLEKGEALELEFDIGNTFFEGPVAQYNVIADLVGSEYPDEYVIVGGHLDSWDGAQGAVDNGTGCATTIEAARLLVMAGARPKRTIRFALWSGEEQGLFGSEGYVRDHAAELERTSAVLIHDGGTNYLSGLGATFDMEEQLRAACAPIFTLDERFPFRLRVGEGFSFSPDSDHAPFAQKGVPGFFWDQAGKSDYDHMHHTQYDTFETAVPEYQAHSSIVAALAAYGIANLPERLSRENFEAIPPRRMGVTLDGTKVANLTDGGKAGKAGWKVGDVVVTVDGKAVATREEVTQALQEGGPRKVFVLARGEEQIESVLDYTGSKDELERVRRAELRAQKREERAAAERKLFW